MKLPVRRSNVEPVFSLWEVMVWAKVFLVFLLVFIEIKMDFKPWLFGKMKLRGLRLREWTGHPFLFPWLVTPPLNALKEAFFRCNSEYRWAVQQTTVFFFLRWWTKGLPNFNNENIRTVSAIKTNNCSILIIKWIHYCN